MVRLMFVFFTTASLFSTNTSVLMSTDASYPTGGWAEPVTQEGGDLDPLINLQITVVIKEIRALDKIDKVGEPDFYVKIFINDVEHTSPVWFNRRYVKPDWFVTEDVPDDEENVNIKIQLWEWNDGVDKLCDISRNYQTKPNSQDVKLTYNLKTGHWMGDDYISHEPVLFDRSGYGRLNGCDDNSMYEDERDCELLFDIYQNDFDGDGIPYWSEIHLYGTDPTVDDTGRDDDNDGVPIEWEHKWGYDPLVWDDHSNLDPDNDGLDNVEEYLTSKWGSDPFRKDIFLELDQMELGPNGEGAAVPELSKELLREAFSKHNIVFHINEGWPGGGETIPFDVNTSNRELQEMYFSYFLHRDPNNWKRGTMRYGLITYHADKYGGFVFATTVDGKHYLLDSFQISTSHIEKFPFKYPFISCFIRRSFNREYQRAIVYASGIMHEIGHTLGIFGWNVPGCDNPLAVFPHIYWWKFRSYKSCMNYNYCYNLVDYSDGSRGENDFDDWGNIDLTFFQREIFWRFFSEGNDIKGSTY